MDGPIGRDVFISAAILSDLGSAGDSRLFDQLLGLGDCK